MGSALQPLPFLYLFWGRIELKTGAGGKDCPSQICTEVLVRRLFIIFYSILLFFLISLLCAFFHKLFSRMR
jgi:hypothetical protein